MPQVEGDLLLEEIEEVNRKIMLGMAMMNALADKGSPLSYLVERAKEQAVLAGKALLQADFTTEAGVKRAKQLQDEYLRFQAIMTWISDAGHEADEAMQLRDGEDDFEEEKLRKQINYEPTDDYERG